LALAIVSFVADLTNRNERRSHSDEWKAYAFVRCLKGERFRPEDIVFDGRTFTIKPNDCASAVALFVAMAGQYLRPRLSSERRYLIAPVPSSKTTLVSVPAVRTTLDLAEGLAGELLFDGDVETHDLLRWDAEKTSTRSGGTRDAKLLAERLRLIGDVDPDARYILVDDVWTSGGHLRAAASVIKAAGGRVAIGVAAAHAVHESLIPSFQAREFTLDD